MLKLKYLRIKYIILLLLICSNYAFSEERYLLGTICKITIYDSEQSKDYYNNLVSDAFAIIEDIETRMSMNVLNGLDVRIRGNELFIINNNAGIKPVRASNDILNLIRESNYYSEISGGRFDITIGPISKLWNIGTSKARVPAADEIKEKLGLVDYRNIEINQEEGTVFLRNRGMMIDLGGIAKGYACDRIKGFLLDNGIKHAVINLGGNVLVIGNHPEERPWKIGIQDPFMPTGTIMGIINAIDETIVTSGIYERYFIEDGIRYHHILNAESGYPVNNSLAGVTIITDNSTKADALSTTVFLMGYMEGMSFIEETDNLEAVFITKEKKVYLSSGIKDKFSLTDDNFTVSESPLSIWNLQKIFLQKNQE